MRTSTLIAALSTTITIAVHHTVSAFVGIRTERSLRTTTFVGYRSTEISDAAAAATTTSEAAPFAVDSFYDHSRDFQPKKVTTEDPSNVEFVSPETATRQVFEVPHAQQQEQATAEGFAASSHYPFAAMMQGSAAYIADHAGKIAVFHLPGEILEGPSSKALLQDIALCWMLGLKIVIVAGCRYREGGQCTDDSCTLNYAHECHNALKVTDREILRRVEEEAGYLRCEIERQLNRCLRVHGTVHSNDGSAPLEGNVVSGNFYTAQQIGQVRGKDYQYTGFATETHTRNILQVLNNNDVVVLSTVGLSPMGELVNVNGYHLAATVAASLGATKLIYMANQGSVLQRKGEDTPIQELPLSFAQAITEHHQVSCHNPGFATFKKAKETLDPAAVELLLHLGWSAWAVDKGVTRAHIVNQADGALLEELFTPKNGANTCIYHDDEQANDCKEDDDEFSVDWDAFFESAAEQGQSVAHFD